MNLPPAFFDAVRGGILRMVDRHPWMLDWSPAHVTDFYVALIVMRLDFKPSVN